MDTSTGRADPPAHPDLPEWWSRDPERVLALLKARVADTLPRDGVSLVLAAADAAAALHRGQQRAGGEPYVVHPWRVALSLIAELEVRDPRVVAVALLHDVLEDTPASVDQLGRQFGSEVARGVQALTRSHSRGGRADRSTDPYVQGIVAAGATAVLLKLADKLDNIRDALYHPSGEKTRLYVREAENVYLPLARWLGDERLRHKVQAALEVAIRSHAFSRVTFDRDSIKHLACVLEALPPGGSLSALELASEVHQFEGHMALYQWLNPRLAYWPSYDGIDVVKGPHTAPAVLGKKLALALAEAIRAHRIDPLLRRVGLPGRFADTRRGPGWQAVILQLEHLAARLERTPTPEWQQPLADWREGTLALCHTRLFVPPNAAFPLWHPDWGARIVRTASDVLRAAFGGVDDWCQLVESLLDCRQAFWRYQSGISSGGRLRTLLTRTGSWLSGEAERERWLSARLLTEYLDLTVLDGVPGLEVEPALAECWRRRAELTDPNRADVAPEWELVGLREALDLVAHDQGRQALGDWVGRLRAAHGLGAPGQTTWIAFNLSEIRKRVALFRSAVAELPAAAEPMALAGAGIHVEVEAVADGTVLTVRLSRAHELRDRFPEVSRGELAAIARHGYSATSLFDTLILDRLARSGPTEPLWLPRVYRALDTMSDLAPGEVQWVDVSFSSHEPIAPLRLGFPLPTTAEAAARHPERVDVFSRFLVACISNHLVTLGFHSLNIDCGPADPRHACWALGRDALRERVLELANAYHYDAYGRYVQSFFFRAFRIEAGAQPVSDATFTGQDMRFGVYVGIDVGGTDTKLLVFNRGEPLAARPDAIPTFPPGPQDVGEAEFYDRLIGVIGSQLERATPPLAWPDVEGIGISWSGAVQNSRIVAASRTLSRIRFRSGDGELQLREDTPPALIHEIDIARRFRQHLLGRRPETRPGLAVVLVNDGDAEAYGHACLVARAQASSPPAAGTLVLKLGTSLAGAHMGAQGAISPHVGEFSRLILDFAARPAQDGVVGTARSFVSAQAVRELSRSFRFQGRDVFGPLGGANASDNEPTRVESVELGLLLPLWKAVDEEPLECNRFLDELAEHDNRAAGGRGFELVEKLSAWLATAEGQERLAQYAGAGPVAADAPGAVSGAKRSALLLGSPASDQLQAIDGRRAGEVIVGAVALFSQLALHTAHLIAALYNVYKRHRFDGVILAGGVLSGLTGLLVQAQTARFMRKHYDKIYGESKSLRPGSFKLATHQAARTVGTFGAAMAAHRADKMSRLGEIRKRLRFDVLRLKPGQSLTRRELLLGAGDDCLLRFEREGRAYIDELIEEGLLYPAAPGASVLLRALRV